MFSLIYDIMISQIQVLLLFSPNRKICKAQKGGEKEGRKGASQGRMEEGERNKNKEPQILVFNDRGKRLGFS